MGEQFNLEAVARGFVGGREMARELHSRVMGYLSDRDDLARSHDVLCYMTL